MNATIQAVAEMQPLQWQGARQHAHCTFSAFQSLNLPSRLPSQRDRARSVYRQQRRSSLGAVQARQRRGIVVKSAYNFTAELMPPITAGEHAMEVLEDYCYMTSA